jgi:ERCC4-related helicase
MLAVGSYAMDMRTKHVVQIIEREELWGICTCKVYDAIGNRVYSVDQNGLSESSQKKVSSDSFIRFVAAWCRVKNELANGIVFDTSESVIPLPHQRYALERVMRTPVVRYMLADEVGLGKTIEAGLIIKELETRGLIERVLVVAPKGLTTQWEAEMQEKFGENFTIVLPEDIATLKKLHPDQNIYEQFTHVITSMDSIKPMESRIGWSQEKIDAYNADRIEAIVSGSWDLIIIDEAHRVAGSSNEVARHKLATMLAKSSPNLLLLTATPHSGKTKPFLRLMRLLDRDAFPNPNAIVKEQVAPYLIRSEKREAVDNDGRPLFKKRHTQIVEVSWQQRHLPQKQLYEAVTEYVRVGYNRACKEKKSYIGFLMILFQRLVSSSTDAIADALARRIHILEEQKDRLSVADLSSVLEDETEESLQAALQAMSMDMMQEKAQLDAILSLARQAKQHGLDAKMEELSHLLVQIREYDAEAKIILFTEFVATQKGLSTLCQSKGFLQHRSMER